MRPLVFAEKFIRYGVGAVIGGPPWLCLSCKAHQKAPPRAGELSVSDSEQTEGE